MQRVRKRTWQLAAGLLLVTSLGVAMLFTTRSVAGSEDDHGIIARGGGTTIIHGGTGPSGGFVPVLTTLAFHAERFGGVVTGTFECLALAPGAATGAGSGQFTVNAMYVTGKITGGVVSGDTATVTGTSTITGLGAGTDVPFTFVVRRGGPGATAVLTVNTLPTLPFHEVLVQGSFEVKD